MTREEIVKALGRGLKEHGLEGRGRNYSLSHSELEWLVQLEFVPRTDRVEIYVGVSPHSLIAGTRPTKANDCAIILHPESGGEPFGLDHWEVWQAFSSDSDLLDIERLEILTKLARAVAEIAKRVATVADLRFLAAEGHLRGFVRKDARVLLFD